MGPSGTGPQPFSILRCYTHRPGMKCVLVQSCLFISANRVCTSGCPSVDFRSKVPTCSPPPGGRPRVPNAPELTTNINQNIAESTKSSPILFQVIPQVIFHPVAPVFSPNILIDRKGWPALTGSSVFTHADHTHQYLCL